MFGHFQDPLACQELDYSKGDCWTVVIQNRDIIVNNVDEFPGHLACNPQSKSEIVLPLYNSNKEIVAILDIDSEEKNNFDEDDI